MTAGGWNPNLVITTPLSFITQEFGLICLIGDDGRVSTRPVCFSSRLSIFLLPFLPTTTTPLTLLRLQQTEYGHFCYKKKKKKNICFVQMKFCFLFFHFFFSLHLLTLLCMYNDVYSAHALVFIFLSSLSIASCLLFSRFSLRNAGIAIWELIFFYSLCVFVADSIN